MSVVVLSASIPLACGIAPAEGAAVEASQIRWSDFQDAPFLEARRSGSPLVLYFETDGCAPCKEMHDQTFVSPAVLEAGKGYKWFRVSMSSSDPHIELVEKSFRVMGAPTVILFGADGQERARRFGFIPPEVFATMLGEAGKPQKSI